MGTASALELQDVLQPETRLVRVCSLRPSEENDLLYSIRESDPEIQKLADSIREHGLLEPIVVTPSMQIISGHRRHAACLLAGPLRVPARILSREPRDRDELLVWLREFNRQREKTVDERLRECE